MSDNCTLSADGYGAIDVLITTLNHGLEIIGSGAESPKHRVFNATARTSHSFSINIKIGSNDVKISLITFWLMGYAERVSTGAVSEMRVQVPSRNFDRFGILKTGIHFGDQLGRISWNIPLGFVGARGLDEPATPPSSKFIDSTDADVRFFYPGSDITAAEEDALVASAKPGQTVIGDVRINDPGHTGSGWN